MQSSQDDPSNTRDQQGQVSLQEMMVSIRKLDGSEIQLEVPSTSDAFIVKRMVCEKWNLEPKAVQLLFGDSKLHDEAMIEPFSTDGHIVLQLIKFDYLPLLGKFDASFHTGISIVNESELLKTNETPDSNNVFCAHSIREPCFVEFKVVASHDELSIGVTYEREIVEQTSGYSNLHRDCTWIYSKRKAMPALFFAGHQVAREGVAGIVKGDIITVFVDPEAQLINFFKNSELVASNLPGYPLPLFNDRPLWMYVMVDRTGDHVVIDRFGPGKPFS